MRSFGIKTQGFSLVEMIVYIALLIAISVSAIFLMLTLRELLDVYRADQRVTESAQIALERMLHEIRAADTVNTADPDSLLIDSPGHLVLLNGTSTTEFSVVDGRAVLTVNGSARGPLTQKGVSVDELRFFRYDNGATEAVRVRMTVSASVGDAASTATFGGTAVLLGSYD